MDRYPTGDERRPILLQRMRDDLQGKREEIARLTRERDEARAAARAWKAFAKGRRKLGMDLVDGHQTELDLWLYESKDYIRKYWPHD